MARIQQYRVQTHPTGPRLPRGRRGMGAEAGQLLPRLPAVDRAEQPGILHPGIDRVRIGQSGLEMPHSRELPGMRRVVVPQVRPRHTFVRELVAHRLPGLATIVRALDHLPEPAAGLRGIEPIRIGGPGPRMIDLPAAEVWAAHVPLLALAVRRHDERAFARADQHPYLAHLSSFLGLAPVVSENPSPPTISPDRPISLTARIHGLPVHCLVEWTRAGSTA